MRSVLRSARPLLAALLAAVGIARTANAQRDPAPAPVPLAAFFWHDVPNDEAAFAGIERGLRAAGIDAAFTVKRASADRALAKQQLAEIGSARPRLVFALGTQSALLAREHLRDTAIVFTAVTHPIEAGLAKSWDSAGANMCGNSNWISSDKVLKTFQLVVPGLARLGVLRSTRTGEVSAAEMRQMQRMLWEPNAPRVELLQEVVERADDLAAAVARLRQRGAQAIWVPIDVEVYQNMHLLLQALAGSGIPLVSSALRGVEAGAVAGAVVDYGLLGERAAALAQRVLRDGVAPAALPIGTMHSSQVVVNLAGAKACGYEVPLNALLVADRILDRIEAPAR
jgi:putative ABC transport system substrate-binding protein